MRRAVLKLHRWTGLIAGLYLSVVCITGAALLFRIDLQRALDPSLFTPDSAGPLATPAVILDSVVRAYPRQRVSGIDAPTTTRPTYLAYVISGGRFVTVLLDPVTARVLGELPERSLVRTLQQLHFNLLTGRTGRIVNGIGALSLIVLCLTGPVIWWPRTRRDLHGAVGIWTAPMLMMWAFTATSFAFPAAFRAAVNAVSPITISRAPQSQPAPTDLERPTWSELIDAAHRRAPGKFVARVVIPANDRGTFLVMFSDVSPTPAGTAALTPIYLDQFTGAVVQETSLGDRTAGDAVMAWVAPLHVGSFGGMPIKVVWAIVALAAPLLFVTGLSEFFVRKRAIRSTRRMM